MAVATYRGFTLKSTDNSNEVWQVQIKTHLLSGNLAAVKKSIDWWCDTASLIDPKEFESVAGKKGASGGPAQEQFGGFVLRNDTGEANEWYCMFNGKLIKGSKIAIQKHIESYILAQRRAAQGGK
ncbi:DUF3319 domain-containing protein [Vibrio viridaestus]|uniref:DUF3319 domain-containing protein n=1 Tax=Vibrio viridaestus TaxID=2487322 RepID=A0A3N9TKT2_9VIBR|nr:DUF3319 domain-containing protein [Vibrio viridaestus]RQW64473.1 DUF3319 domain-containing protein [Vibrio viridaestus]